jgi:hypothetical protein
VEDKEKMSTEPLKKYIQSIEHFKNGNDAEASSLLAESVGIEKSTPYMQENLPKLVNASEPNDAILTLVIHETKRRK